MYIYIYIYIIYYIYMQMFICVNYNCIPINISQIVIIIHKCIKISKYINISKSFIDS